MPILPDTDHDDSQERSRRQILYYSRIGPGQRTLTDASTPRVCRGSTGPCLAASGSSYGTAQPGDRQRAQLFAFLQDSSSPIGVSGCGWLSPAVCGECAR